MNNVYLTEDLLSSSLQQIIPGQWIHDKKFIGRTRPDFRNDAVKLIVEFDGSTHYTSAKRIVADKAKDFAESQAGYKVVRIPYFVQLSAQTIKLLFSIDVKWTQTYQHGFIDKNCILPADFCELGISKFKADLKRFSLFKVEILESLERKIQILGNRDLVLPPSLNI